DRAAAPRCAGPRVRTSKYDTGINELCQLFYETQGGVCARRSAKRLETSDSTRGKAQKNFQKNRKISCNIFLRVIY
ncbi:MAG: hypothetical protein LBD95_07700, partial [Clostridiales Family XIII bacterium]|nr:hypothetical protein [Clostridiales Family XIII bacterium]